MRRLKTGRLLRVLSFVAIIFVLLVTSNGQAQVLAGLTSSATGMIAQGASTIGSFFSQGIPGALDSCMPLLFPPYFGGDVHVRPYFYGILSAQLVKCNEPTSGIRKKYDLTNSISGIGLSGTGSYIENMARLQLSRLSIRAYYNLDTDRISASSGYMDWMDWRIGIDYDVINSFGVRLGATCDFYPQAPNLYYQINGGPINGGLSGEVEGSQPLTLGIVAGYNPFNSWIVSPTFEFRYEWPWPNSSSVMTQWEYAIGLKLPKTVVGSSGLRFGQRYTDLKFGSQDSNVTLVTEGYFGEFVWFY